MKFSLFCTFVAVLFLSGLAAFTCSLNAEALCPGNIPSVTPRIVAHALIVIPVMVNGSGPFDFMLDTGSQVTVIDPSLAAQLNLKSQGSGYLVDANGVTEAFSAQLDKLETGSHSVEKPFVFVQDIGFIQAADRRIRGVLGQNFLTHFDLLIDYPHKLVCLDAMGQMQKEIRGERVPLVPAKHPETEVPFTEKLVISVHLSDTGSQPILLQLDSGSDGPIIYANNPKLEAPLLRNAKPRPPSRNAAQRLFADLPLQNTQIGTRVLSNIPFATPANPGRNTPARDEDGLLPTILFQRVYISTINHYVVFDPR